MRGGPLDWNECGCRDSGLATARYDSESVRMLFDDMHAMSDVAKWKLRGPVRTLRKEHAEWDSSRGAWQAPRGVSTITFRRDGQLSESEFHNPDGSVARSARSYDDHGRLVEEQFWRDVESQRRVVYSYDDLGRLTRAENVAPDGTRREAERCRYDNSGHKTRVTFLPHGHTDISMSYGVEGTDHAYGAPGAVALTIVYDDRGLSSEASFHDANGGLVRRIVFSRDRDGRLLTEVVYFDGESPIPELQRPADNVPPDERADVAAMMRMVFEGQVFCKTTYVYDTNGRLVERTTSMGSLSEERTTYQYHDHDDPIVESSMSRNRRVAVDDHGVLRTVEEEPIEQHNRYDYQHDSRGNWIERIAAYRIGSQPEFRRSNIERRTITYHEGPESNRNMTHS